MLSALPVNGTAGDDVITLGVTAAGGVQVIVNGSEVDYVPGLFDSVELHSGAGNDVINVRGTVVPTVAGYAQSATVNVGDAHGVRDVAAPLAIESFAPGSSASTVQINLNDSGDAVARDILIDASGGGAIVKGLAPAPITYGTQVTASSGGSSRTVTASLITGAGDDSIVIHDAPAATLFLDSSGGNDSINVGDGMLPGAFGEISVRNGAGRSHLTIDDSTDPIATTFLFSLSLSDLGMSGQFGAIHAQRHTTPGDLGTVVYNLPQIASVTLLGGGGGNSYDVNQPMLLLGPSPAPPPILNISAGDGTDTVNVLGDSVYSALNLNDGGGFDQVNLQAVASSVTFNSSQELGGLVIGGRVNLKAGGHIVLTVYRVNIGGGGQLDLANNELDVPYLPGLCPICGDPVQGIRAELASGYDHGAWSGRGIITSMGDASHGLGYVDQYSPFKVVVKYALYGDTNLDGKVDFTDLLLAAQNYGRTNRLWQQGDFNYDATTNFADLILLAANYGRFSLALARKAHRPGN